MCVQKEKLSTIFANGRKKNAWNRNKQGIIYLLKVSQLSSAPSRPACRSQSPTLFADGLQDNKQTREVKIVA